MRSLRGIAEQEEENDGWDETKREGEKCRGPTAKSFVFLWYARKRNDQPLHAHTSDILIAHVYNKI